MSSTTSSSGGEDGGVCRIVFLVSGIGMPRDATSDAKGNSTEGQQRRKLNAQFPYSRVT